MAQFTTAEVAEKFGTTPRTLRKFLRSDARNRDAADTLPGKGSRYTLEGKDLKGLQGRFSKWQAAEAAARAQRAQDAADAAQVVANDTPDA
jgi:predicted transcriptional regulator